MQAFNPDGFSYLKWSCDPERGYTVAKGPRKQPPIIRHV
jgi:hypothetical protein